MRAGPSWMSIFLTLSRFSRSGGPTAKIRLTMGLRVKGSSAVTSSFSAAVSIT